VALPIILIQALAFMALAAALQIIPPKASSGPPLRATLITLETPQGAPPSSLLARRDRPPQDLIIPDRNMPQLQATPQTGQTLIPVSVMTETDTLPPPAPSPVLQPVRFNVAASPDTALVSDTKADVFKQYRSQIRAIIMAHKPGGHGLHGEVTLHFRLDKAGGLHSSEVAKSSGTIRLDRLALGTLRRAAPFPDPPEQIAPEDLDFSLTLRFHP
ncbi:MAG: energy transducer TonB, partial [Sphingomonadaceae bacterium]